MNGRRIWLAVAMIAVMAAPAQAEDFWSSLKKGVEEAKKDFKGFTGALKDGFEDITEGKKEVEEVIDDARQLQEEFTGTPENEPRYDAAWVAELQQRLTAEGFDPGPVDGAFGNRTARAIAAFQRQFGVSPDGLPTPTVMRALRARTQGVQIAQPSPSFQPPSQPQTSGLMGGAQWAGANAPAFSGAAGSPSFETAPEPDYRSLLEMLIAANPDAFDSPDFALYYASLELPTFPDRRCLDFVNALGNEISRRRITEEAQAALNAVLAASPRTEQARVFRMVTNDSANEYDFERGGFPIEPTYSSSPFRGDWSYRSQLGHEVCSQKADGRYFGSYRGHWIEVPVPVQTGDRLLAMAPDQAQSFIDRNRTRGFETEWLIDVRTAAGGLTGRVIAARARERRGGPVLYDFDPGLLQPPAADPGTALVATLAPPLSPYVATLHALKRIPDLLDQQQLIELTRVQIEMDQRAHDPAYASVTEDMPPVFAAEQVEGRLPVLAAEELAPAYRAYLNLLAAEAPVRLRAEHRLNQLVYDSASGMLRCCEHYRRESFDLLTAAVGSGNGEKPYGIPESVEPLALYRIGGNNPDGDQGPSAGIRNGIQRGYLPGIEVLAFDRRLELKGIPLDRAQAEQLLLELRQGGSQEGFTAIVEFTVEDVRRDPAQPGRASVGAMLVRLDQVVIRGPKGAQVTRFAAETFPLAQASAAEPPPSEPDPVTPAPSHERLTLAYLASQPQLADDPTFAQRYAAASDCEAWTANRGDEFARADLGDQARRRISDALAQGSGGSDDARYRVSIEAKVGEYDFAKQRFPLQVPIFDQSIYRNLLDAPVPALLIEHGGRACRNDSVANASFPDAFLLTLAGAKAIDAVGVPADQAAAKAFVQRDLPTYRDPRAVEIEMVVRLGAIPAPRRTHPQRDEHVSIVSGTVISAKVLDAHSGEPVFDYGTDLFEGASEPIEEPALAATQSVPGVEPATGTEPVSVARPDGPYGPDVAGIWLGMSFEEAEAVIRESMQVGFVYHLERDPAQGIRGLQPYNAGRIFVSPDASEAIGIFDEPPAANGIVLGAWRRVVDLDPNLLSDDVAALLAEKYGPPARSQDSRWEWGETASTRACVSGGSGQGALRLSLIEGAERNALDHKLMLALERLKSSPPRFLMDDPGLPPEIDRFRGCGPVVRASFGRQQLDVALFDYGRYNERYLESYELLRGGFVSGGNVKVAERILGTERSTAFLKEPPAEPAGTIDLAALAKLPAPGGSADERGADQFKILDITVGMTGPEVLAAVAGEFSPDQIAMDPESGALRAEKGPCNKADPADPAIASEAGAFCLELQFTEGVVSRVGLRQVVSGDVSERALAAFRERYGEPAFEDRSEPSPSVRRSIIGWGRSLGGVPLDLAGVDPDAPRTVLEGRIWWSNGVTIAILRLDDGRPAGSSNNLAAGQEIKF